MKRLYENISCIFIFNLLKMLFRTWSSFFIRRLCFDVVWLADRVRSETERDQHSLGHMLATYKFQLLS